MSQPRPQESTDKQAAPYRLLLVDDTPANIDVLVGLLKQDYQLRIATSGERALKICSGEELPDLILLDIMMPGMDGFEVCRRLRGSHRTREIPIIFLTAKSEVDDIVHGFQEGGNDYLTKPFRPEELMARIQTHLTLLAQKKLIEQQREELRELVHIICHDVSNHFGAIEMALEMRRMGIEGQGEIMEVAVHNGIQMTSMVRQLQTAEEKPLTLEPVDLKMSVHESLLLLKGLADKKSIRLDSSVPSVEVLASPCALVNSVLNNILTNALKFSEPGSTIHIRGEDLGDQVLLTIRDHGVGMSQYALDRLFDVGQSRSRPGTQGEAGSGFGMPLMKRFVERFGGRVEARSQEQSDAGEWHGTEMRVFLLKP